jgi:ascorbate-specific PTS system EIIC-type component UlaA
MRTFRLIAGFIFGFLLSFLAISIIVSASNALSSDVILAATIVLFGSLCCYYFSTSSRKQRILIFAIAGCVFMLLSILFIPWTSLTTESASAAGLSSADLQLIGNINNDKKLYAIYAAIFSALFFIISALLHLLNKRNVN